jgi:hypothetical protein
MAGGGGREVEDVCPIQGIWPMTVRVSTLHGITASGDGRSGSFARYKGVGRWDRGFIRRCSAVITNEGRNKTQR